MYEFNFKPFNEMTEEDYKTVGFKSGLEIHQQLLTDKKLFCRCPAGKFNKNFDAEILRHMRPTLSELGEYDGTALMEFKTKKDILYRIKRESVCTYEMDDTPPFLINEDALNIALETGLLFDCNMIDELHIARKQYLDGSIPTGFQRTAIYALDGQVPYKDRIIDIVQMSIEEDSCREMSDVGHKRIYITDRLGMPLIETVTAPQMFTPFECEEVAWLCSNVVRSTNKVRRGSGAARQDVNVSVTGGTRIEIKGVPQISLIPILTYNESMRQWNLLKLREELKRRGITEETFEAETFDITSVIKSPKYLPLKKAVDKELKLKCVLLKGFNELLHWQTQTNTYFANEISDRVRVIACLTNLPNIIHSDSKGETLTSPEWTQIYKSVGATNNDTVIVVWGTEEDTDTASKEIIIRAKEATVGIPSETRQALDDGTNGFERILPGADRMYPDTDLPPKKISQDQLNKIREQLPDKLWDRIAEYKKLRIPEDTIQPLSISKYAKLFKTLVNEKDVNPTLAAVVLIQYPKRLKRNGLDISKLSIDVMEEVFNEYTEQRLTKDGILSKLYNYLNDGTAVISQEKIISDQNEIQNIIDIKTNDIVSLKVSDEKNRNKLLIGSIMNTNRHKLNGADLSNLLDLGAEK